MVNPVLMAPMKNCVSSPAGGLRARIHRREETGTNDHEIPLAGKRSVKNESYSEVLFLAVSGD
jgi:hypothetical protein